MAKKEQIELQNQIARRERIPIEDVLGWIKKLPTTLPRSSKQAAYRLSRWTKFPSSFASGSRRTKSSRLESISPA